MAKHRRKPKKEKATIEADIKIKLLIVTINFKFTIKKWW